VTTSRAVQDVDTEKEVWKKHHRAKFPKMVFYFESIPDDIRAKLTKRVTYLGAVRYTTQPTAILSLTGSPIAPRAVLLH
jgi:hypothetical protein